MMQRGRWRATAAGCRLMAAMVALIATLSAGAGAAEYPDWRGA